MSKKQYILITPKNPEHSLSEAGLRVTRTTISEEELHTFLESWPGTGPDFYLQVATEPVRYKEYTVKPGATENKAAAEFNMPRNILEGWLETYGSMDPDHRVASIEITRVAS